MRKPRAKPGDKRAIAVFGMAELRAQYVKLSKEIGRDLAAQIGAEVLEPIRVAISSEIMSAKYKSDLPYSRKKKRGHRNWPLAGLRASPGHARRSWARSLRIVPLGSLQSARYEGARILATGKSGSFYGRLIERGHRLTNYWREKAPPGKKVRGRFLAKRVFKAMQDAAFLRAYRLYFNAFLKLDGRKAA